MKKCIITVVGKDSVGIIAKVGINKQSKKERRKHTHYQYFKYFPDDRGWVF